MDFENTMYVGIDVGAFIHKLLLNFWKRNIPLAKMLLEGEGIESHQGAIHSFINWTTLESPV